MPLKLYYWDLRGRAENIRVLLKYLKVNYREINPSYGEWPNLKKKFIHEGFSFPNLPMIDDRGFMLSESKAILTYLAQTRGDGSLAGKTPQDQAIIKQIEGVIDEVYNHLLQVAFTLSYKSKLQQAASDKLLRVVKRLQNHFADGRDYAVGYFTVADIMISGFYRFINNFYRSAKLKNPMEKKILYYHTLRVSNLPGIKEYYASSEYKNRVSFPISWLKEYPLAVPSS